MPAKVVAASPQAAPAAAAPAPAAPPAPVSATPAPAPVSTRTLQEELRAALAPAPAAEPAAAPTPEEAPPAVPPAPESPPPPDPETPPAAQWPTEAIHVVTGLRAERRELRADLEAERASRIELETRLSRLEGKPPGEPVPTHQAHPEVAKARTEEAGQLALARWAKAQLRNLPRQPEQVKAELARQQVHLPEEQIESWLEGVQDAAETQARKLGIRAEVLASQSEQSISQEQMQSASVARRFVPELSDPQSDRAKLYQQIYQEHPHLKSHPRGDLVAAAIILGFEQILPQLQAPAAPAVNGHATNGAPKHAAPKPPVQRLPGASPRLPQQPNPSAEANQQSLFEKFKKSGDPRDREAWARAVLAGTT